MKQSLVLSCLVLSLCLSLFAATPAAKPSAGKKTAASLVKKQPPPKRTVYPKPALANKITRSKGAVAAKEWTVLYYLDADNNLEPDMLNDVNEMEQIGSTDNVNLVVLLDRNPSYDDRDGNWTNNRLDFLTRDKDQEKITSKVLDDLKEMDMGDPQTLVNFVAFGLQNFPAKHYAVVLGDHGGTWMSSLNDETNNEGGLKLAGLISALDALKKGGAPTFDLMVFDMCLMSQVEVMDAISPYVSYAVASEELEPGSGYPNHRVLYQLTKNPQMGPADLAQVFVQEWSASYKEEGENTVTSAATDLSKIKDVVSAVDGLAAALMKAPPAVMTAVGRARSSAQHFPGDADSELNSYDIGDLALLLSQQPEAASLKPQLDAVMAAVDAAVIKHEEGATHQGATGLAFYFPFDKKVNEEYKSIPFTRTQWDEFLLAGGGQAAAATADVKISSPDPAQPHPLDKGIPVTATVSGSPASIHASIGIAGEDGSLTLISDEEIKSPGAKEEEDGSFVPEWKDGMTFNYTIQPQVSGISDGRSVALTPLFAMSPGSRFVQGYASYNSMRGDMQVAPVFDTKSGGLETVFCLSEKGNKAAMAVHPVKGEKLVFYQPTYTGENKPQKFRPTPALTTAGGGGGRAGSAPSLKLVPTDLPKGEYVFILTAYAADGEQSGYDVLRLTADGEGVAPNCNYPDYGYPAVSEDDLDYVDLTQVIPANEYDHFQATWDDYDFMDQYEDDDFDADDLNYLDDVALDEEDLQFDEADWSDELQDEHESGTVEEDQDEADHDENVEEDQSQDDQDENVDQDQNQDEDQDQDNVSDDDNDHDDDQSDDNGAVEEDHNHDDDQSDDNGAVEDDQNHDDDQHHDNVQSDDSDDDSSADDQDDDSGSDDDGSFYRFR